MNSNKTNQTAAGAPAPYTFRGVDSVHFLMIYGTPENQEVIYDTGQEGGA